MGACSTKGHGKHREDGRGKSSARSTPSAQQGTPAPPDTTNASRNSSVAPESKYVPPAQNNVRKSSEPNVDPNQTPLLPKRRIEKECVPFDKVALSMRGLSQKLLQAVAVEQSLEATIRLLQQQPDPNILDAEGDTPLCHAIVAPAFHSPRGLAVLSYLATPQAIQASPQALALCGVVGRVRAAVTLLALGAACSGGELCAAMANKSDEDDNETFESEQGQAVIGAFLEACSINEADEEGFPPLHLACKNGRPVSALLFVSKGASIVQQDSEKCLPIHHAMSLDETDAAVLLVKGLATEETVNAQDEDGDTPLHHAALFGKTLFAKTLMQRGADPSMKNREGKMPAQVDRMKSVQKVMRNAAE